MLSFKRTTTRTLEQSESLTAVKDHLRITGDWADAEIERYTLQAIQQIEERTRTTLLKEVYERSLFKFPSDGCIVLPRPPTVQVESIRHDDTEGVGTLEVGGTLVIGDDGLTDEGVTYELLECEPAIVRMSEWPTNVSVVRVKWSAGVETWTELNPLQQQAILLVTHHLYYNRDGSPFGMGIESVLTQLMPGDDFTYAAERLQA